MGFYAQHAAGQDGDDGAACAWRSVKGSEKGAYEGRIRRGRLPSDVGFICPTATPIARHPADCGSTLFSAGQSPPVGYAEPIIGGFPAATLGLRGGRAGGHRG